MKLIEKGNLQYLKAENIEISHGFTTRKGGVSRGYLDSLNLGCHRGDSLDNVEKNYDLLGKALGFSREALVLACQVHGDAVRPVTRMDSGKGVDHRNYPQCDGLVTDTPGLALMVFAADCTPILFWDQVTGAVGACHAGWRGTAAGIAGKTVAAMVENYGCEPRNIRAAIGPNIGQCCFETRRDVPDAMVQAFGQRAWDSIRASGEKYYVNLKELNALSIRERGVENIEISTACTSCRSDLFWSHRVTEGKRGSQGAVIVCKERMP